MNRDMADAVGYICFAAIVISMMFCAKSCVTSKHEQQAKVLIERNCK